MSNSLFIYNTLSRKKEEFEAINPPFVGLYVCGPTVYGDPHLGHVRPVVTFDLLFRYLRKNGYKVRYVRNITDVGHLEHDADHGEDKIAKKARIEQLEPMEVVQYYTDRYHFYMSQFNVLSPSIEPRASGHIIEQQQMVRQILDKGFAYESKGSVYFDITKYNNKHNYGILSGRNVDDMLSNTRQLAGQNEKRNPLDFALWKKAAPEHIMHWPSEWSEGFPGWHLECSVMSTKYLGQEFDIHGGGMDLQFPHHECEIAQNTAAQGKPAVKYWMHNNMITINGQKMGKSLGNFITLEEMFSGTHKLLERGYEPMVIRFFMLQAHYRSTLDFSNEALQAAEKGLKRLMTAAQTLQKLDAKGTDKLDTEAIEAKYQAAMDDDLNSPILISHLFDTVKSINAIAAGTLNIDAATLGKLQTLFDTYLFQVLGLSQQTEADTSQQSSALDGAMKLLLQMRQDAKASKDWAMADKIRKQLKDLGFEIKDATDGASWEYNG